jgi:hypothetical protein
MLSRTASIVAALILALSSPALAGPDDEVDSVELATDAKDAATSPARRVKFFADGRVVASGSFGDASQGTAVDTLASTLLPGEETVFRPLIQALARSTSSSVIPEGPFDVALNVQQKNGHLSGYQHRAGEKPGLLGELGSEIASAVGVGDSLDAKTGLPKSVVQLRALADVVAARLAARVAAPAKFDSLLVYTAPVFSGSSAHVRLDSAGQVAVEGHPAATLAPDQLAKLQALFARADFGRLPVVPGSMGHMPTPDTGPAMYVAATYDLGDGVAGTRTVYVETARDGDGLAPVVEPASAQARPFITAANALGSYAITAAWAGADAAEARARVANNGEVPGLDYTEVPLFPKPGDREREIQALSERARADDARTAAAREGFVKRLAQQP